MSHGKTLNCGAEFHLLHASTLPEKGIREHTHSGKEIFPVALPICVRESGSHSNEPGRLQLQKCLRLFEIPKPGCGCRQPLKGLCPQPRVNQTQRGTLQECKATLGCKLSLGPAWETKKPGVCQEA